MPLFRKEAAGSLLLVLLVFNYSLPFLPKLTLKLVFPGRGKLLAPEGRRESAGEWAGTTGSAWGWARTGGSQSRSQNSSGNLGDSPSPSTSRAFSARSWCSRSRVGRGARGCGVALRGPVLSPWSGRVHLLVGMVSAPPSGPDSHTSVFAGGTRPANWGCLVSEVLSHKSLVLVKKLGCLTGLWVGGWCIQSGRPPTPTCPQHLCLVL